METNNLESLAREIGKSISEGTRWWLFLDYDGTLADFAPDPGVLSPDPSLAGLVQQLASFSERLRVVVLTGRSLPDILVLLPVRGVLMAGSYGVEYRTWEGQMVHLIDFDGSRPVLEEVKRHWLSAVDGRQGFFVEDKGCAVALHTRNASLEDARVVIDAARRAAGQIIRGDALRLAGTERFLEVAPVIANKGQSVRMLLERFPWPGARMAYLGDDDKDEPAFEVIRALGGLTIRVGSVERESSAEYRLNSPADARQWLEFVLAK